MHVSEKRTVRQPSRDSDTLCPQWLKFGAMAARYRVCMASGIDGSALAGGEFCATHQPQPQQVRAGRWSLLMTALSHNPVFS